MAEEQTPDTSPHTAPDQPARSGRRLIRLFLMVAGGLAAPCLALAAFFLSSGGDEPPARPAAVQAGQVQKPAGPTTAPAPTAAPTTSTTVAPVAPAGPLRDPFAPLVTQAPPAGTPPR